MSVQGNWVDGSFALLNGAATFLTLAGSEPRPHEVSLVLPPDWRTSMTGLAEAPGRKPHHYMAPDFDTLVDSPIYAGNPAIYEFQVDGVPHYLVNEGEGGLWDGPRSARDVEAIVRVQKTFWGFLPYEKYVFFNLLTETGGGLEHKNSTVLMASRWATRTRSSYLAWLNLVSHEFFHTWNVKRLRPVELGPFDYENEVYTPSLWVAEGITSYYDRLLVRRAGLCTVEEYLAGDPPSPGSDSDKTTNDIERLQTTPGRLVQPLEASSFEAWIKFYRRDENTPNTGISYYVKGAVVAFLLDARIRRATSGKKSLDDVMRLAYERYSGPRGFTAPAVPRHRAGGRRRRSVVLVPPGPRDHRGARLRRGPRLVRPPLRQGREEEQGREQAAQGLARPGHQERGWPPDGQPGQARHARIRRGFQRRRRDPGHRR